MYEYADRRKQGGRVGGKECRWRKGKRKGGRKGGKGNGEREEKRKKNVRGKWKEE